MTVIDKEPRPGLDSPREAADGRGGDGPGASGAAGAPDAPGTPGTPGAPGTGAPSTGAPSNGGQVLRLLVVLAVVTALFVVAGLGDLLLFIAILIVVVMLHELGHFVTAKWAGMKVTEYFVGFGPRLWSVRRGETEYGVKAIPAGGYVRITGFTVLEDVSDEDEPRAYRQQPFWKRIIVGSAGSAMHFLIAFVLALIAVFAFGVATNNQQIMALDHWKGVAQTPAQKAGLQPGDTIVAVDGKPLSHPNTLSNAIAHSVGVPVTLRVDRGGKTLNVAVTPVKRPGMKSDGSDEAASNVASPHGYIGIELQQANKSVSPTRAVVLAADNLGQVTSDEITGIGHLFSPSGVSSVIHQVSSSKDATKVADNPGTGVRPVSVIGIARLGPQAQHDGIFFLLEFLILVNIVFGLLNMLPMLPFDGGHVAVAAYEWVRTKKGEAYYKADITKIFPVVFVVLAFLSIFVVASIYLDITHPIKNLFP
jgi:membrane-associated protease RseP (regulator of RpoE activity)